MRNIIKISHWWYETYGMYDPRTDQEREMGINEEEDWTPMRFSMSHITAFNEANYGLTTLRFPDHAITINCKYSDFCKIHRDYILGNL